MGNILSYGLDAYKQTMKLKDEPPEQKDSRPPAAASSLKKKELKDGDFLKTVKPRKEPVPGRIGEKPKESKYRRIAKFFILIGSEQAAEILAELDPKQVEKISKEIAFIKKIDPEEAKEILEEFHAIFSTSYRVLGASHGGIETARRILYAAKGPVKGEALLNRAVPDSKENLFSFLDEFSAEQLVMIIKNETPQTIALLLSRLQPKLSAEILSKLPADIKPKVLKRVAYQKEVSPEVLVQVSQALKEKVRHITGGANDIEIDGMQKLAAILKQGDYAFGDRLIDELAQTNPDIGKDLKEKLYTLDDVIYAVDRPIQDKLSEMTEQNIAILLKGKSREFSEKILSCVSANRRQLIREESEILGAVPKRDSDSVSQEFLSWFRQARENGDIILYSDEDVIL